MLRDVKQLLHTAAYHPAEIDQVLDPDHPSFLRFDPVLGYTMIDHAFRDGMDDTVSTYTFEKPGGTRKRINAVEHPCRINTYGDSFTQCAQVSDGETWQEVLAAHFREPIRNFGVGGYGVYTAYNTAMRWEPTEEGAEYIVLNIWDDDHKRSLDAARWIRVAWMCRDLPRGGGEGKYPVHGFPWAHVRYDLDQGAFVERPGLCKKADDLRDLADKDAYYEAFKDDHAAHLYALTQGGEAPIEFLETLAEAFELDVDLRTPETRVRESHKLHWHYGLRASRFIVDKLRAWAEKNGRKLMIMLTFDVPSVTEYIETGERFDQWFLDYLRAEGIPHIDCLTKAADEYKTFNLSVEDFLGRFYIPRAGAQVFGHYSPAGNFWLAQAVRKELAEWLDPKPRSYR